MGVERRDVRTKSFVIKRVLLSIDYWQTYIGEFDVRVTQRLSFPRRNAAPGGRCNFQIASTDSLRSGGAPASFYPNRTRRVRLDTLVFRPLVTPASRAGGAGQLDGRAN